MLSYFLIHNVLTQKFENNHGGRAAFAGNRRQRLLRFLDERSVLVFRFDDAATFYRIPSDSPQKSELPVRAGLREVKKEEESVTPEGMLNPCGS